MNLDKYEGKRIVNILHVIAATFCMLVVVFLGSLGNLGEIGIMISFMSIMIMLNESRGE